MQETMQSVLARLPADFRPAAETLWRNAASVTSEATETLLLSYRLLSQMRGEPERLSAAAEELSGSAVVEVADARDDIGEALPAVSRSWQGHGAAVFGRYSAELERAMEVLADSAAITAEAIGAFGDSLDSLWTIVIDYTFAAAAEVRAATTAPVGDGLSDVIAIIDRYSTYVDELTETLMSLTTDSHAAGRRLSETGDDMSDTPDWPLPAMPRSATVAADWNPAGESVNMDLAAMAKLTSALSDSRDCWQQATVANNKAAEYCTPEAFGLAGSHFHGDVHAVLDRDREGYSTMPSQLDSLAQALRSVSVGYSQTDDDVATELRRDTPGWV